MMHCLTSNDEKKDNKGGEIVMADVSNELKSPFILPRFSLILGSVWSRIENSDGESFMFAIFNSGTKGFRREDSGSETLIP